MEEKKDINSLIGFALMGAVMILWLYLKPPIPEQITTETSTVESAEYIEDIQEVAESIDFNVSLAETQNLDDNFNNNASLVKDNITYENDLISLEISNKGGFISNLYLKNYNNHLEKPIYLITDESSIFNLNFKTLNNREIDTKNQLFTASEYDIDEGKVILMKLIVSEDQYLEYKYIIKPDNYMIDFSINSKG